MRLPAIAAAAARIKAKSFTIDGEAVALGADGLSRFDDLRRREAARSAMLYAFDLIEHDGRALRDLPFLDRKAAPARLLRDTGSSILLNEHVAEDGPRRSANRAVAPRRTRDVCTWPIPEITAAGRRVRLPVGTCRAAPMALGACR